jgi:hypothetical protein
MYNRVNHLNFYRMKNLIFSCLFMLAGIGLQAQCTISGPSTITIGQSASYSIPALAQCNECYDWDVVSGSVSISGSDQNSSVTINANGLGSFQLRVTWFDEDGCHQCTVNGSVPCDVTQDGIFFVNLMGDVNLKFYTMPNLATGGPNSFSYEWTFTYADNSTSGSGDREPYIPVPCDNPIKFAFVRVSSASCFKDIDKQWLPGICGTGGFAASSTANSTARTITVSPNPASSVVNFTGNNLSQCTVSVYDNLGRTIIQNTRLTRSLDITTFKTGVYVYVINGPDGYTQKGQIIKK